MCPTFCSPSPCPPLRLANEKRSRRHSSDLTTLLLSFRLGIRHGLKQCYFSASSDPVAPFSSHRHPLASCLLCVAPNPTKPPRCLRACLSCLSTPLYLLLVSETKMIYTCTIVTDRSLAKTPQYREPNVHNRWVRWLMDSTPPPLYLSLCPVQELHSIKKVRG
ncbi:MAG: hypothetical protein J3Q66DRAFT_336854 [Benniella sp.]|nr:MAG: hypothetical protein J3Q66DRAFT_336854 [Benniella sp.]